ncbi:MAG TPA: hypothetical protein VNO30_38395 [Kofleriaceae bacterium]|nr:hypothetical protein [Kofleriaceae bacterium]
MADDADWLPVLLVRDAVEKLRSARRPPAQTHVNAPPLQPPLWDESDAVEFEDLLTATLGALARSRGALLGAAGIALADDPIPITFQGELVGVSEGADRLWFVVTAQRRSKDDA